MCVSKWPGLVLNMDRVGQNDTYIRMYNACMVHLRCIYSIFGGDITVHSSYGVHIRRVGQNHIYVYTVYIRYF